MASASPATDLHQADGAAGVTYMTHVARRVGLLEEADAAVSSTVVTIGGTLRDLSLRTDAIIASRAEASARLALDRERDLLEQGLVIQATMEAFRADVHRGRAWMGALAP